MSGSWTHWALGFVGGVLLAVMLHCNSLLAAHTTPTFASWAAHGIGAVVAGGLVVAWRWSGAGPRTPAPQRQVPWWTYLGGIPGAFAVILAAVTVNSVLALAGTIALVLSGQILFGMMVDHWGWLNVSRRRLVFNDLVVAGCVFSGSLLIILFRR